MWMALIAALLGGGSNILGSILQNNRMKDIRAEAKFDKEYGLKKHQMLKLQNILLPRLLKSKKTQYLYISSSTTFFQ